MKEKLYRLVGSEKYRYDGCVLKVKYGDKYIIAKCKDSFLGLKGIENALHSFLRGGKNNPDGYYCHFFDYVKANLDPSKKMEVSYLSQPKDSPYKLLVIEQQELDKGLMDPNMLNNQRDAHISLYDEGTGLYGWISPADVLNFQNWKKRQKRARSRKSAG